MITKILTRDDVEPPQFIPTLIKAVVALFISSFAWGLTGDIWLALFTLVGLCAVWAIGWILK